MWLCLWLVSVICFSTRHYSEIKKTRQRKCCCKYKTGIIIGSNTNHVPFLTIPVVVTSHRCLMQTRCLFHREFHETTTASNYYVKHIVQKQIKWLFSIKSCDTFVCRGAGNALQCNNCVFLNFLLPRSLFQKDLECLDPRGRTPLHLAVTLGHLDCARVLLQEGANVNKQNHNGWTGECAWVLL